MCGGHAPPHHHVHGGGIWTPAIGYTEYRIFIDGARPVVLIADPPNEVRGANGSVQPSVLVFSAVQAHSFVNHVEYAAGLFLCGVRGGFIYI